MVASPLPLTVTVLPSRVPPDTLMVTSDQGMALLEDVACIAGRLGLDLCIDGITAGNRRHIFSTKLRS